MNYNKSIKKSANLFLTHVFVLKVNLKFTNVIIPKSIEKVGIAIESQDYNYVWLNKIWKKSQWLVKDKLS